MDILNILVGIFFLYIIIRHIHSLIHLKVKAINQKLESFIMIVSIIALVIFVYFYSDTISFYIIGTLAIIGFISIFLDKGICENGFVRQYRSYELIKWENISKVTVSCEKHIKIELIGDFIECSLYFKLSDYDKIMAILKEKVPSKIILNIDTNIPIKEKYK